ncbi:MAG: outer membrane protein assembly factor BamE [Ramlibacter sp.]
MGITVSRAPGWFLALAAFAAAGGCSSFDKMSESLVSPITPYKVEVVQGNFVSREQVAALKTGMSRQQVRDILGTPLVTDAFHTDRWDYVFTLKRQGVPQQSRKLTVFFNREGMERVVGDEMPTEAEFVATLDNRRKDAKVPVLEASEESLKKFSAERPAAAASAAAAPTTPAAETTPVASYPSLESPAK